MVESKCRKHTKCMQCHFLQEQEAHTRKEEILVRYWTPPQGQWMKLSSDGAANRDSGRVASGSIIRDSDGRWVRGRVRFLGNASST